MNGMPISIGKLSLYVAGAGWEYISISDILMTNQSQSLPVQYSPVFDHPDLLGPWYEQPAVPR